MTSGLKVDVSGSLRLPLVESAKSPLTQMCGGRYIAEIHRRWDEEFEASSTGEEADAETRKELVRPKREEFPNTP